MDELNPPVVLNYATPSGHGDAPPAGSRLSLRRVDDGVCIVEPPKGRVAAIPGLMAVAGVEFVLLLILADVLKEWMQHGIAMGAMVSGVGVLMVLIGGLVWQAKIVWQSVQLPRTVEVSEGFLRLTNLHDLFGRDRWRVEKVRRVYAAHLGFGFGIARRVGVFYDVTIVFRGLRAQRRVLRYLSKAEAIWAANVLNRAMGLPEVRGRRRGQ